MTDFLPICKKDMINRNWDEVDFVYITGDAYVDHPSFGVAIISRVLEAKGFKIGIVSQPDIYNDIEFTQYGKPRLGFLITSGNIDSMVAHYTVAKKKRKTDSYSPGGIIGKRPDRAVIVYSNIIRKLYPDSPIILGGLEASLRRFAHYDYWDDAVRPSILIDSKADLLIYGMGENQVIEIAQRLNNGESINNLTDIKGTSYCVDVHETPYTGIECPSYDNVCNSKKEYAKANRIQMDEQDHIRGKLLKQKHGKIMVVQNPPMPPLTQSELDWVYSLPYKRTYHPIYEKMGGVPGIEEVEFSITHNRGCFGGCHFCAIAFHQGRYVTSRSKQSIVDEAKLLTTLPNFKGYIHDIGGPTANFRKPSCEKQKKYGLCKGERRCLAPTPCSNLVVDHSEYLDILRSVRSLPGIKKVFIRSGIRYDYLLLDKDETFFKELVKYHVSGQLKVAPEHCSAAVLDKMGKPHIEAYIEFSKKYFSYTNEVNKEQYLVPYLMSSHPGSTLQDAIKLAEFLKKNHIRPEQVQDFYPTPGTVSTTMYYTGLDPYTMEEVYVAKNPHEKALQRALLQYYNPKNRDLVEEALKCAKRYDLIGTGSECLIRPKNNYSNNTNYNHNKSSQNHTNNKFKGKRNGKRKR